MRFGVLGPLEVIAGSGPVRLGGQKQRVLLALLLVRPGRVVSVDALVQGLWGDDPPRSADKTLQSYVVHLRHALEPDRPRGAAGTVLVTRDPGYLLRVAPGELDAARFEELATHGRRLLGAGAAEAAATTLREALGLWRGEAFEEFPQVDACAAEAARLAELRLGAVEERVEADLALGHHRELFADLEDLTRQHPLRERLWGQLLLALYRCGRQAEALLAYQRARATLVGELGIEPGVELRRLHAAILAQDPDLQVAPAGWLGAGRRRELPAALEVVDPVFVGRDAELGWLRAAWAHASASSGHGGVVLVSGPAGIGKTRLAAEFAYQVHQEGALVLYGRCDPAPSSPLQPLEQALAGVGTSTQVVPLLEGEQPPAAFGAALAGFVAPRGGEQPGVLVVLDDLHLAAAATLEALVGLAGAAEGRRLLVLGAYRDDAPAAALAGLLGRPPLSAAARRRLEGLSVAEMARIVAAYSAEAESLQAARTLLQATGGIPALVHQAAGDWARSRATKRVEQAAAQSLRHRRDLRAVQGEVADNVVELQQLRGRRGAVAGTEIAERGPDRSPPAAVLCPYKGLARFEPADRELFFGREHLVAELVTHLVGPGLLGVVGPSGSGKSSVVRAGLLPALADGVLPGSARWTRVVIRPGEHPLDELAGAAHRVGSEPTGAAGTAADRDGAAGEEGQAADQPIRALTNTDTGDGQGRLVLVVDQFEEVFTSCHDQHEQAAFLAALTAAAQAADGYASVVVVVRADYYGHCAADRTLAELLAADHVLVGPMTADELRRAIVRPADRAGLQLEAGLVEQLLDDVAGEPGGLPLLSCALLEGWQHRQGRTLTLAGYHASGGVKGAVARLADRALGRLNPGQQAAARRLLLRLAGPGEGELLVGRRVPLTELDLDHDPDMRAALAVLTEARLLTTAEATVEVAHEALLRQWPRLRGWLEEDTQGRALHRHLTQASRDWQAGGRDPAELYRGARLAAALDWATEHPAHLNQLERAYLDRSRQAAEHEVTQARQRAEQEARSNRRLRGLLAGLAAVLVVAVVAGTLAVVQQGRATRAARLADARRLVTQALVEDDLDRSLLLAAQANRLDDSVDTRGALLTSLLRSPQAIGVLRGTGDRLLHLAVSPDGRTLAAGDQAGRTLLWDTATRRPLPGPPQLPKLDDQPDPLQLLAFSSDGRLLLTAGSFTIHRWDLATHQVAGSFDVLRISSAGVGGMAVSPDGRRLAVGTEGKVLWLDPLTWTQASPPLVTDKKSWPDRLTLSPDGRRLAMTTTPIKTGGAPGRSTAGIWDLASGRQLRSLDADGTLAFSPDGRTLAASHRQRGEILLIDPATGKRRRTLTGHPAAVVALRFSHDGATLASTDENGTAIIWDLATGRTQETLVGHTAAVTGVAFSPDDRTLYTASGDRSVLVWDLAGDRRLSRSFTAARRVSSQSFSKRGALLARGYSNGMVTLTDLTRRAPAATPLQAHSGAVQAVALSPDGRLLASADAHTAIVWDLATRRPTGRPIPITENPPLISSPDITDLALSPDGKTLAIGDNLDRVTLWDLTSRTRWVLQAAGANSFQFSPDGTILAVASHGGEVRLWEVAARSLVPRWRLPADRTDASAVAFTPDGRTLATGGQEGTVVLWDMRTGRQLGAPLVGHASGVANSAFSPDGRLLATVNGEAILWDLASHTQIGAALPIRSEGPHAVAFLPGGSQLAVAAPSGSVLVWDVNPTSWRARACAVAGRTLTRAEWDEFLPGRPYQDVCPA
jgi:WD40 repeat protein/DNA-binding SARP family transcriptional activator